MACRHRRARLFVKRLTFADILVLVAVIMVVIGGSSSANAADKAQSGCRLTPIGRHTVVAVIDAETIRLDDGREVRLADIRPPRASDVGSTALRGRKAVPAPWPREQLLVGELARVLVGQTVVVATDGRPGDRLLDRYGRLTAHILAGDSHSTDGPTDAGWLQAALLGDGFARLEFAPGPAPCLTRLVVHERKARAQSRGLWHEAAYRVRSAVEPRALYSLAGTLQTIEGVVARVGVTRARVYLDFGTERNRDFGIVMRRGVARELADAGTDPALLAKRRVRVTGWLDWHGGPRIEIEHVAQFELVDAAPVAERAGPAPSDASND